jgi:hypothetical protein
MIYKILLQSGEDNEKKLRIYINLRVINPSEGAPGASMLGKPTYFN